MTRPARSPAKKPATKPLSVLVLHDIGHGDTDTDAGEKLAALILDRLDAAGRPRADVRVEFLRLDTLFGAGPDMAQIARGLPALARGAAEAGFDAEPLPRGLSLGDLDDAVRWTAGLVIQWIEDAALRTRLCRRLMRAIGTTGADVVIAHGLGSLIAYDALRRAVAAGGAALAALDGLRLVGLGSQIANPVVVGQVWGGRVMPLHDGSGRGIARWYQLTNPFDKVFTCPIGTRDDAREDLLTPFPSAGEAAALFTLNHAPQGYLDHPLARQRLWPALARIGAAVPARALSAPAVLRRPRRPRQRALLVGINAYPDAGMRLEGCVNDVFLMSRHLQRHGFDAGEIRLLVDERATQAAIVERLHWLTEDARDGDERLFLYSGHGAQIPAYGDNDEPDHRIETLVPVDFRWDDENTHFTDKQFRRFYADLPFGEGHTGARLTAIFDCCHAAGMTRSGTRVRGINPPPDIRHRMLRWVDASGEWGRRDFMADTGSARAFSAGAGAPGAHRGLGVSAGMRLADRRLARQQQSRYGHGGPYLPVLLYAAHEAELAGEYVHGVESYGAFTFALVEQLERRAAPSFEAVLEQVAAAMHGRHFAQRPELVGPRAMRERPFPWSGRGKGARGRG